MIRGERYTLSTSRRGGKLAKNEENRRGLIGSFGFHASRISRGPMVSANLSDLDFQLCLASPRFFSTRKALFERGETEGERRSTAPRKSRRK